MVLTVTPFLATSSASALVKPCIPAFAAEELTCPNAPFCPFTDEILIIRPQPRSVMPSQTCLVMLKQLSRLVLITASQLGLSIFLNVMSRVIPALLTSTSTGPTSLTTCATHAAHESQSTTSQGYARNA